MRKAVLFLCICVCAPAICVAQHTPQKKKVIPEGMIDGSVHPEKIPDLTAYRLFLVEVSPRDNWSPGDDERHAAQVQRIPLSDADRITLEQAIANFHMRYHGFLEWYKSRPVDEDALATRDTITQDAITYLQDYMSPAGFRRLDAFIQRQKTRMKRIPMPKMANMANMPKK